MENPLICDQERKENNLKEILTILFKHKIKIMVVFSSIILAVTVVTFMLTPIYEAKSTMLVKMGREYQYRPEVGDNKSVVSFDPGGLISSEIQIISSRELIEKVIKAMKIETIYPDITRNRSAQTNLLDAAVLRFEKGLVVEGIKNSRVIQVSFQHEDPRIAALAANMLVEFFKEKHLQVFSEPQASYQEQQLESYTQKLKASENTLESFKQKNRVFSLDEQRSLLLKQRMEMDTELKNCNNSISELQKKVVTLRSQLKSISTGNDNYGQPDSDKNLVETKSRLLAMQLNEQELLRKYTENNRMVINARNEIALVQNFLKEQEHVANIKAKTDNPLYQEINRDLFRAETDLNSINSKAASIKRQMETVDGEIRSLNLTEKDLDNLKREKIVNEKNYQSYQVRAEESRRLDEMNRLKLANISMIQLATPSVEPVKPKKAKILLIGYIFGAVLGIGSAFLSESLSQTFSSPEKVEQLLGLPVLLSIPYSEG